jgi:hypothetical protein
MEADCVPVEMKRTRPGLLTAFILISFALSGVVLGLNLLVALRFLLSGTYDALPIMILGIAVGIARLIALLATWHWKRWGIYLWFACAVISGYMYVGFSATPGRAFLISIAIVVFFFSFWSRWDDFE